MKGKVKKVHRSEGSVFSQGHSWEYGEYSRKKTQTHAKLDNGDDVFINEDEIREVYGRKKITDKLINQLENDLKGKEIEYDDRDFLIGPLTKYLPKKMKRP